MGWYSKQTHNNNKNRQKNLWWKSNVYETSALELMWKIWQVFLTFSFTFSHTHTHTNLKSYIRQLLNGRHVCHYQVFSFLKSIITRTSISCIMVLWSAIFLYLPQWLYDKFVNLSPFSSIFFFCLAFIIIIQIA